MQKHYKEDNEEYYKSRARRAHRMEYRWIAISPYSEGVFGEFKTWKQIF